jgi:hypothetical protein
MLKAIYRYGDTPGHFLEALWFDDDHRALIAMMPNNQPPSDGGYVCFVGVRDRRRVSPEECARNGDQDFSTALEPAVIRDVCCGRSLLVLDLSNEGPEFDHTMFDAIHRFLDRHDIPGQRVVWLCQNRAVEAAYVARYRDQRTSLLGFDYYDFYLKLVARWFADPQWRGRVTGESRAYSAAVLDPARKTKYALCLNATPREHRICTVAALQHYGMLERCLVSFTGLSYAKGWPIDPRSVEQMLDLWQMPFLRDACAEVIGRGVMRVDDFAEIGNQLVDKIAVHNYLSTCFSIVTESDFSAGEIDRVTEKTVKTFCLGHPCFVIGNPGALKFATDLGFQSFAPALPAGYDLIASPPLRFVAAFAEILSQVAELQRDRVAWLGRMAEVSRFNITYATGGLLRNYKDQYDRPIVMRLERLLARSQAATEGSMEVRYERA